MKPDWKDAPEWANWLAKDHLGFAFFELEPQWGEYGWQVEKGLVDGRVGKFEKILERRP